MKSHKIVYDVDIYIIYYNVLTSCVFVFENTKHRINNCPIIYFPYVCFRCVKSIHYSVGAMAIMATVECATCSSMYTVTVEAVHAPPQGK